MPSVTYDYCRISAVSFCLFGVVIGFRRVSSSFVVFVVPFVEFSLRLELRNFLLPVI